jgi:hypothetical protein
MLSTALALITPQVLAAQGTGQRAGYHAAWWTTADGLPGNFVTDIVQGEDGRLWIIAGGVLTRFDGRAFEVIPVGQPEGARSPMEFPTAIERGAGDTLWVSTYASRLLARTRGIWVPVALKKGMTVQEVEQLLGPAKTVDTDEAGGLEIMIHTYEHPDHQVVAKFASGVLVDFAITPP